MIPTSVQVEGEFHRQIAELKSQFLHVFDPDSVRYGTEMCNWYGRCKDCGIRLLVYTGKATPPFGVRRWEPCVLVSKPRDSDFFVWLVDYEQVWPNALLQYPDCKPRSTSFSASSYDGRPVEEARKKPKTATSSTSSSRSNW